MKINETDLVRQDDPGYALRVPKELVDVVVSDDGVVILLLFDKDTIVDFVRLVTNEAVEGSNDRAEVETLWDGLCAVLALWGAVIVVCTLEDEAEALWDESDLGCFTPAEEI